MSKFPPRGMSVNREDPLACQKTILVLFNANMPEETVLNILLPSFPSVTAYEVAFWYARFKAGNTNLDEPIPSLTDALICSNLPRELLTNAVDNVSTRNQVALGVSAESALGESGTTYSLVELFLDSEKSLIMMSVLGAEQTFVEGQRGKRDHDDDSPYPYVDKVVKELKKVIEQPQVKINRLKIALGYKKERPSEKTEKYFLEEIYNSMAGLSKQIDVKVFEVGNSTMLLRNLISCLNPSTLNELVLLPDTTFDMQELVTLPHWRHLKSVYVASARKLSLESVVHLQRLSVYVSKSILAPGQLATYKKKLLEQQHSFEHEFLCEEEFSLTDCLESLEPCEASDMKTGYGYFLRDDGESCFFTLSSKGVVFNS